ncbi:hypothetical protein DL93DRAFT_413349 [Clavulina sp. PMI_390]|nr:hypothetical protein DL93DRAFT_413349 [Clavulina sp. PMI_390]
MPTASTSSAAISHNSPVAASFPPPQTAPNNSNPSGSGPIDHQTLPVDLSVPSKRSGHRLLRSSPGERLPDEGGSELSMRDLLAQQDQELARLGPNADEHGAGPNHKRSWLDALPRRRLIRPAEVDGMEPPGAKHGVPHESNTSPLQNQSKLFEKHLNNSAHQVSPSSPTHYTQEQGQSELPSGEQPQAHWLTPPFLSTNFNNPFASEPGRELEIDTGGPYNTDTIPLSPILSVLESPTSTRSSSSARSTTSSRRPFAGEIEEHKPSSRNHVQD